MLPRICCRAASAVFAAQFFLSGAACAHHAMDGKLPASFMDGLLSGLGHPILGPDHFAFVLGIGLLAAVGGMGLLLPALFVGAMIGGVGLHLLGANIPFAEALLALSVLAIGVVVVAHQRNPLPRLVALAFAAAGVLHGYAFGESIVGAEPTPLVSYLAGLALMQLTIAGLAFQLTRASAGREALLRPAAVRALGLTIAVVGAVFLALNAGIAA